MTSTTMINTTDWTQNDEHEFFSVQKRLGELNIRRQGAIGELRSLIVDWKLHEGSVDDIVATLIQRADDFRDALAPFDSGVRNTAGKSVEG